MKFINRYFQYELLAHCWVQIPLSKLNKMIKEEAVFSGDGYKYENENGETYVEFHVDDHPSFSELEGLHQFGGNLSVCRPKNEKPLLIFGQDECLYKQYAF